MGEAVRFAQRYNYPTNHPLDVVMAPKYFDPARRTLRAGDTIRAVQLANPAYETE